MADEALEQWVATKLPPPPPASTAGARRSFQGNRSRDTAPELALRRALHRLGLRYLVDAPVPGLPARRRADVLLRGSRIAVFLHGCYWHRCPEHSRPPKRNSDWWVQKFAAIERRDADTVARLTQAGWLPVIIWEHQDPVEAAQLVQALDTTRRAAHAGRPRTASA